MKSIIHRLLYDTDKSTLLHYDYMTGYSIYLTQNKRLFVTAGCDSFIKSTNHNTCKEYLGFVNPDKYIELFGEVEEA